MVEWGKVINITFLDSFNHQNLFCLDSFYGILMLCTVIAEIKAAPQKIVIPKENRHNSAFSFGITHFWVRLLFRILRYLKKGLKIS